MNRPIRLLLLPGLDGSAELFEPLLAELPRELVAEAVSYPAARRDYEALLPFVQAALPSEGPFVLLGWSFSGPLALMVAAGRPQGLRGVILPHLALVTSPRPAAGAIARFCATLGRATVG